MDQVNHLWHDIADQLPSKVTTYWRKRGSILFIPETQPSWLWSSGACYVAAQKYLKKHPIHGEQVCMLRWSAQCGARMTGNQLFKNLYKMNLLKKNRRGCGSLHWAIGRNNLEACYFLRDWGLSALDIRCGALNCAALHGHVAMCQFLKDQGLTLKDVRARNNAALCTAARNNQMDVCQFLLDWRDHELTCVKANEKDQGLTPEDVRKANEKDRRELCSRNKGEALRESEVGLDWHGAFIEAAKHGHLNIIKLFMRWGLTLKDVRWNFCNVLNVAAENGHLEIIQFFVNLEPKISLNIADQVIEVEDNGNGNQGQDLWFSQAEKQPIKLWDLLSGNVLPFAARNGRVNILNFVRDWMNQPEMDDLEAQWEQWCDAEVSGHSLGEWKSPTHGVGQYLQGQWSSERLYISGSWLSRGWIKDMIGIKNISRKRFLNFRQACCGVVLCEASSVGQVHVIQHVKECWVLESSSSMASPLTYRAISFALKCTTSGKTTQALHDLQQHLLTR